MVTVSNDIQSILHESLMKSVNLFVHHNDDLQSQQQHHQPQQLVYLTFIFVHSI